jgi:hypothetical protein
MMKRIPAAGKPAKAGQVMVLTVLALGGTILGATTVAGLLMLYQVRQATDLGNSARAIFAADAGMEQSFFNIFCKGDESKSSYCPAPEFPVRFSNGAAVKVTCYDDSGSVLPTCDETTRNVRAVGSAGNASRAFEANF